MRPDLSRRLRSAARPLTVVLVISFLMAMAVPALLNDSAPTGAIIKGRGDLPSDAAAPAGDGPASSPQDGYEDFEVGALSSIVDVEVGSSSYQVRSDEYSITVAQDGNYVDYTVRPYFTDDVVRYRRVNPNVASEGTVDQNGKDLNWVSMTISDHGQDGNRVWFVESCPQFSMRQEFTIYRDYFELDTTYIPGSSNAVVTYFVGLYDERDGMIDLFSDGQVHRYVPGFDEERPSTHGIGGWYPSFEMFAPSFDLRQPKGDLGVEWGFSDEEAYLWAPIWMKDFGGGGPSTFCLKFSSKSSVLPDPSKGEETTYHMFVRPYKHTDGEPIGHNYGYAKWVAYEIAKEWTVHNTPIFPLTMNTLSTWDQDLLGWVEGSQITVAMQSTDPDQINWHYKSSQLMIPHDGTMPASWQLHNAPGQQMYSPSGYRIASAASAEYRDHLINGDPYNDWWWSSDGVFWDEMNVIDGSNNIRNDYNQKDEFVYTGFLRLVEESYESGKFEYTITNPFTALLHLAMVSDLSLIEGYEPVPMYNNDLKAHTRSVMNFVNNMPAELRPHISVDQNYAANSDKWAVYSVLFDAAKYGFNPNLRSYDPGAAQIPNLAMAEAMFLAMGADRHSDPKFWPAVMDLRSEGPAIVTGRPMVVLTGDGSPSIEFTGESERYALTNLWSAGKQFTIVLPTPALYEAEGLQDVEVSYTADGKAVITGTIAAEATGYIVRSEDVAVSHSVDGVAFVAAATGEVRVRATGGETTLRVGNLLPSRSYEVFSNGSRIAAVRADESGWITFTRSYGAEEVISVAEAPPSAPTVLTVTPSPGAADVPVGANITITFSAPMDRAAVEDAFSIRPDAAGSWSWSKSGDSATFTPDRPLMHNTEHIVELSGLRDVDGMVNDAAFSSGFRTAAGSFELSGRVSDPKGAPIGNASVELAGRDIAVTGSDGAFSFDGLPAGDHLLAVSRDGYSDVTVHAAIADQGVHVDVAMQEKGPFLIPAASGARSGLVGLEMPIAFTMAALLLFGLVATGRADRGVDAARRAADRLCETLHRLRRH